MAKPGSVVVALLAVVIGLFLGFAGVTFILASPELAGASEESRTFLGLFGDSSGSASVPAGPWMGLVMLLMGGALLLFGLRAMFVTFEGRGEA